MKKSCLFFYKKYKGVSFIVHYKSLNLSEYAINKTSIDHLVIS